MNTQTRHLGLILLPLLTLMGCSQLESTQTSLGNWWSGKDSAASVPVAAPDTSKAPAPAQEKPSNSSLKASNDARSQREATTRALAELRKAQAAADEARRASEQAAEAYKQASEAAAQLTSTNVDQGSPKSPTAPPALSTSAVVLSSVDGRSTEENPERIQEQLQKLGLDVDKIDRSKLDSAESQRLDLAGNLIKSAQKAFVENDYPAANSLAAKASVIMAPFVR